MEATGRFPTTPKEITNLKNLPKSKYQSAATVEEIKKKIVELSLRVV